jgi:hypothetical protein
MRKGKYQDSQRHKLCNGLISPRRTRRARKRQRMKCLIPLLSLVATKKFLEIDYPRSKTTGHSANFILT